MSSSRDTTHPQRKRLRKARKNADLSIAEMARLRGACPGTIHDNELTAGKPGDELVNDYAAFTGESERYLRTGRRQ
jgi:hypothetical protein